MHSIAVPIVSESYVKRALLLILAGEHELQTDFHQLEAAFEELVEFANREVDYLLLVNIVVRLEVDSLVGHVEQAFDLHQRQDSFHFELAGEERLLGQVLYFRQVERYLRDALASHLLLQGARVKCVRHIGQHLVDFDLIAKSVLRLESSHKLSQRLVEN